MLQRLEIWEQRMRDCGQRSKGRGKEEDGFINVITAEEGAQRVRALKRVLRFVRWAEVVRSESQVTQTTYRVSALALPSLRLR